MKKPAIICIDDEKGILDTLQIELEKFLKNNYLIELAQNGEEALEIFQDLISDGIEVVLVIADYIMPGIKGDELLIKVHEVSPKTIKIMLTGQADFLAITKAINKANLYRYINKPWQAEDLSLTVTEALYRHSQERQLELVNQQQAQLITQLHENENRLRQFLDAVPVGIAVFDTQGQPTYLNQTGASILQEKSSLENTDIGKLLGRYEVQKNDGSSYPLEETPAWRALQGESITIDNMELRLGEKILPLESRGTPIYDQNGNIIYAIVAFQDISERQKAQQLLTNYNRSLEIQIAERTEALKKQSQSDQLLSQIARQFINQVNPEAIKFTLKKVVQFLNAHRGCFFEYIPSQNQYILVEQWYAEGLSFITNNNNATAFLPWFNQKLTQKEIIIINNIDEMPPEADFEKPIFKSLGIQAFAVIPISLSEKLVGFIGVDLVGENKLWTEEDIHLLQRVGELIAIAHLRQKAEEALREAKESAEAANRAKSTFLANMSHELRTPLNIILGFTQLMERETNLNQHQQQFLATINRSGEHLLNLINDVLEMSKIEAGKISFYPVSFDLYRLLETLEEMFQIRAQAKQLILKLEQPADLPRYLITDEGKLRQVLLNLLSNAVKFTQTGTITMRTSWQPNLLASSEQINLSFAIEDTGQGIAPEEINSIFEPFVQTQTGIQAREGTGLGLPISRQFVQLMGGNLEVRSQLEKGSIFSFTIPVQLNSNEQIVIPSQQHIISLVPEQELVKVLIVDDQQENRDLVQQLLTMVGFQTLAVVNGKEAVSTWQKWQPNLILMDMRMPVMDGYQATREIRRLETKNYPQQHTIIIAVTASAFDEQQSQTLAAGCDDFIGKPFQESEIFQKIALHLGVKYIYAEDNSPTVQPTNSDSLQAEDLRVMSIQWRQQMHEAATRVNAKLIEELLTQIPPQYVNLSQPIRELVQQFRFDIIVELTQQ